MTGRTPGGACLRVAAAALLALALALPGCGRPADENWLRVVQFEDEDGGVISSVSSVLRSSTTTTTTTTTTTSTTTEEETSTEAVTADYVYAALANQSAIPGSDAQAGGVTVEQVRISYRVPGYSPADVVIPVSLYVPVSATTDSDGTTTTSTTALKLPLVSVDLKSWLVDRVPQSVLKEGLSASARLTFSARTDEGGEVETAASIGIEFVIEETTTTSTSTTE